MRVLVIALPITDAGQRVFPRHPPLLAAQLAAVLRAAEHEVVVVDAFMESLSVAALVERILSDQPHIAVLMPNDVARETPATITVQVCRQYRRSGGTALLIAAGVGQLPWLQNLVAAADYLDGAVLGDPEVGVLDVVAALQKGADWTDVASVLTRVGGHCPEAAVVRNLDKLPVPAWDLVCLPDYVVLPHRRLRGLEYPLFASRGCYWNRCNFCQDLACVKSPAYRTRSPESVANEMALAVNDLGATHFLFHDAVFPTRVTWLRRFSAALDDMGFRGTWFCMARADNVSPEALALMRQAGCVNVCYGLETGDAGLLGRMDKGHGLDEARRAVRWSREAGLQVSATFIFGFPGETVNMASDTVEFAIELNVDYAQFLLVKWHQVPEAYLGEGEFIEEWELTQYDYRGMVFVPHAYGSLARLKLVRSYAYARFYLRPGFLLRTASRIRSMSELRRYLVGGATLFSAMLNR